MPDFISKLDEFRILFRGKVHLPHEQASVVKRILRESTNETLEVFAHSDIDFVSQAADIILKERQNKHHVKCH